LSNKSKVARKRFKYQGYTSFLEFKGLERRQIKKRVGHLGALSRLISSASPNPKNTTINSLIFACKNESTKSQNASDSLAFYYLILL
jgi:hypothetical protein